MYWFHFAALIISNLYKIIGYDTIELPIMDIQFAYIMANDIDITNWINAIKLTELNRV